MAESLTETTIHYSKYYLELDSDVKTRYEEKIRMIGLVDPYYCLESNANYFHSSCFSTVEWYEWPAITYADVYNLIQQATVLMNSSRHTEVWKRSISLSMDG